MPEKKDTGRPACPCCGQDLPEDQIVLDFVTPEVLWRREWEETSWSLPSSSAS